MNCSSTSIYVLLSHTGSLFTHLIKGFTRAPYNHASIVLDEKLNELFSFGFKRANNPLLGGFIREDVYKGTFLRFPDTRCVLLRLEVTKQQRAAIIQIIHVFEQNKAMYRYNLVGLVGVLLKLDLQSAHSYFCSQFVAETLRNSGLPLWDRPSTLVTPNDFLQNNSFELIYEGPLYDYPLLDRQKLSYNQNRKASATLFGSKAFKRII